MLRKCVSLLLGLLFAATAAAQQPSSAPYTHPILGFSLALPAGWSVAASSADYDLQIKSLDDSCLLQVSSVPMNTPVDPRMFVAEWERQLVGPDKTYQRRVSQSDRTVAGHSAVQGIYDSTLWGAVAVGNITTVSTPGRTYVITFICLPHAVEANRGVVDTALASFRVAPSTRPPAAPQAAPGATPPVADGYLGIEIYSPSLEDARHLGLTTNKTVFVSHVYDGTPAAGAGIRPGDILLSVGGSKIASVADVTAAPTPRGKPVKVALLRRGEVHNVTVVPGVRPPGHSVHDHSVHVPSAVLLQHVAGWSWSEDPVDGARRYLSKGGAKAILGPRIDIERTPPAWSNSRAVIEATAQAKQEIVRRMPGAVLVDGPPYTQSPASRDLPAAQFEAEYTEGGKPMRRWVVVLSDTYGGAVTWSYTSAEADFDGSLKEVKTMLRSLVIFARPVAGGAR